MASRPITQPNTYGTIVGNAAMSLLDTSFAAAFSSGFNDSALGWVNYGTDIGTLNVLAATLTQAPSAYVAGLTVAIKVANTSTGTATLNLNALGAQPIVNRANIALQGGELPLNAVVPMVHDGTSFRIVGPCGLSIVSTGLSGSLSIECAGYTSVGVFLSWSSGTGATVTLAHLAQGVPVTITFQNSIGTNQTFFLKETNPAGTAFTTSNAYLSGQANGGSVLDMIATGLVINNGLAATFTGGAAGPLTATFSR